MEIKIAQVETMMTRKLSKDKQARPPPTTVTHTHWLSLQVNLMSRCFELGFAKNLNLLLVGWLSIVSPSREHTGYLEPVNVVRWKF